MARTNGGDRLRRVGLDWTVDLAGCRERVGSQVALEGNLDPSVLFGSDALSLLIERLLKGFGANPAYSA